MNNQKYLNGQGIFHVNRPVTTPASGTIIGQAQNNPTAFLTVLTSMGMPLEGTINEPTAANFSNLNSRNEVGALDWNLRRNGYDGLTGAERVALRKYADALTDYDRYLNRDTRFARRRGRRALDRIKKYEGQVTNLMDRMRNVTYDANGNAHQEYSEGYDPNGFKTAEEANQYKADAQKWAGEQYMKEVDDRVGNYTYNSHGDLLDLIQKASGLDNADLLAKAKSGDAWGDNANAYYAAAIDKMLADGNYEGARGLSNYMNLDTTKSALNMYTPKSGNNKGVATTLYDASSKFTNDARARYLTSEGGMNGLKTKFGGTDNGYYTAYQDYKKNNSIGNLLSQDNSGFAAAFRKQGGNLNMTQKYQLGGAAPQEQDMQQQIIQLVQAAMSGDEQATLTIQKIMEAAQQGDQLAAQIAQLIQAVAQQMQQQAGGAATTAKRGAKLNYLHRLNTGCPAGTELQYYKKGGHICKACVKKAKKAMEGAEIPEEKCGGKAKKKYFQSGGKTTKQDGFTKTINAVSPGEALYAPENLEAASKELFGTVGDVLNPASAVRRVGNYARGAAQDFKDAYSTVTDQNASVGQKIGAVGRAASHFYLPGVAPAVKYLVGKHENGGELKTVIAENKASKNQYGGLLTQLRSAYKTLNK